MHDINNFWFKECDNCGLPAVLLDAGNHSILKVNNEAVSLLQLHNETVSSLVGKVFKDVPPVCDFEKLYELEQLMEQVVKTGTCAHSIILLADSDGVRLPLVLAYFPVMNTEGKIDAVALIFLAHRNTNVLMFEHQWAYSIVEASPDFVAMFDTDLKIIYNNPASKKMLGCEDRVEVGDTVLDLDEIHSPAYAHKVLTEGIPTAFAGGVWQGIGDLKRTDGTVIDIRQTIVPVKDFVGNCTGVATVISDMSSINKLQKELEDEQKRSYLLIDSAPFGCVVFDPDFRPVSCNSICVTMFQEKSKQSLLANLNQYLFEGVYKDRQKEFYTNIKDNLYVENSFQMSATHITATGEYLETSMTMSLMQYRGEDQIVAYIVDMSEQRKVLDMYAKLAREASMDQLTGVKNRGHFDMKLNIMLAAHKNSDKPLYLVIMDIDDFKRVNDTYGHVVGDDVLKAFGANLCANVRPIDIIARYGGEEFVIIFENMSMPVLRNKTEALREAIETMVIPLPAGSPTNYIKITASFGLAQYNPITMDDTEALCACADRALYKAKHDGKNCVRVFEH